MLRGERARFQLFGDTGKCVSYSSGRVTFHSRPCFTSSDIAVLLRFLVFIVNTASRMESNGLPGRIQVSEATANELLAANKSAWLTEREGGVEAKGKGNLRTFWVLPKAHTSMSSGVSFSDSGVGSGSELEISHDTLSTSSHSAEGS